MARTPAEDAAKLAAGLQALARRLRNAEVGEVGEAVFTNGDLDRIVENRLARELKKRGGMPSASGTRWRQRSRRCGASYWRSRRRARIGSDGQGGAVERASTRHASTRHP